LNGYFLNTLYIFNGQTWQSGPTMPVATTNAGAVIGPDGNFYGIGGYYQTWVNTVQVSTPVLRRWALTTPLPAPLCCMGAVTAHNHEIYAIGGANGPAVAQVAIGAFAGLRLPTILTRAPLAPPSPTWDIRHEKPVLRRNVNW
jgi:hypothetical protein